MKDKLSVKIYKHDDMDGEACDIITRIYNPNWNIDSTSCTVRNIDEKILLDIDKFYTYDKIFIFDISVNGYVAERLDRDFKDKVVLIDHHESALWLKKYKWATVADINFNGTRYCAATLVHEWFYSRSTNINNYIRTRIPLFAELVRQYDTYDWFAKNNYEPKRMNDFFYMVGPEEFHKQIKSKITEFCVIPEKYDFALEVQRNSMDNYIKSKLEKIKKMTLFGKYKVCVCFAEQHISELGNTMAIENKDCDFAILITPDRAVSFRGIKDNINLCNIAKLFKGGGHPKASGCPVNDNTVVDFIKDVFEDQITLSE